jgi:hypothetical protein
VDSVPSRNLRAGLDKTPDFRKRSRERLAQRGGG